ncbi:methyltransferase domain-containing protein [Nocardia colli]|uniref:Methyltransferase domain-containing protein n=1 Tax=Nocardia colli TaxID=2545717 RepID=A0A5N0E585_9NOCA|nr:methyltransferase [Nocardia colli]KAA8883840.1 methyltransferase domain-containing protein [Nocardia colli]
MNPLVISPRALMSLLFNADKAIDVVRTAWEMGILDALEAGPVTLGALCARFELVPARLYKLLDCLECLGLVTRTSADELHGNAFQSREGACAAVADVLGPASLERDRDGYPWRTLYGRLPDVLRGEHSMPPEAFTWPLDNADQVAGFEQSMAAGIGPIAEAFRTHTALWHTDGELRLLDVGGGDGTLAVSLLHDNPGLHVDVYNLPALRPLVDRTRAESDHRDRLGFVGGDFLAEPLPSGYDVLSFVRVLHDWPRQQARELLTNAYRALPPGGRVLICEEFRDAERLARQFFWSYFLIGVDTCASMLRAVTDYLELLGDVGFRDVEVLPGPFEIVVATKPDPEPVR